MTYKEFDELRHSVDFAEWEVVMAAQKVVEEWKKDPDHKRNPLHRSIAACAVQIDCLLKVMEQLPPTDTKVEL